MMKFPVLFKYREQIFDIGFMFFILKKLKFLNRILIISI